MATVDQIGLDTELEPVCTFCDGQGMRIVEDAQGRRSAVPCVCKAQRRTRRVLNLARIPRRYEHCTLDSFEYDFGSGLNRSLQSALVKAKEFVSSYPLLDRNGLLLTGVAGLGKTHLAIGIFKALVEQRGAEGIFYDFRELLKEIQNSYDPSVSATELSVLKPIFEAEVLILDDLASTKPTDWMWDTVAHILNTRYNDCRPTIITTNRPNLPPKTFASLRASNEQSRDTKRATTELTLGDLIGAPMWSRLQEMCTELPLQGDDFRVGVYGARHKKLTDDFGRYAMDDLE